MYVRDENMTVRTIWSNGSFTSWCRRERYEEWFFEDVDRPRCVAKVYENIMDPRADCINSQRETSESTDLTC